MIYINPYSGTNTNTPNMQLAYASVLTGSRVIDLNTLLKAAERYLDCRHETVVVSVQPRSYSSFEEISARYRAKYPDTEILLLKSFVDVQCCYQFISGNKYYELKGEFSDRLPFPEYELFDSYEIFRNNWKNNLWPYTIMTSLGCPFLCTYCQSRQREWKNRSPENCVEELLKARQKYGIRSFQIIDDCFNTSRKRVLDFCRRVRPLELQWFCANGLRADLFDEEMAGLMKESGCTQVSFGIETIDDEILIKIKKGESFSQIEKAIMTAKKYFRTVNGFFIIGLPGSSYEKDEKSLKWALSRGINAHFSFYVPFEKISPLTGACFYGEKARPLSDEYSPRLQQKLYGQTKKMRPRGGSFIKKFINL